MAPSREDLQTLPTNELVARREDLHQQLGKLSARLYDATQAYNDCIGDMVATNDALADRSDYDRQVLIRQLGLADSQEA